MATGIAINPPRASARGPAWTLAGIACWSLLVLIVFINGADFRGATGSENFEVHWQIYLRLLVSMGSGALAALLIFPNSYRDFLSWPGFLTTLLLGWYGLCIPFGIEKAYCMASWICLTSVCVFVPTAMRILGAWGTVSAIAVGLLLFVVGSWIAYLYFPEIGVFKEQIDNTYALERMGGLGHPNELGFYCSFTIILFTVIGLSRRLPWVIVLPVVLLAGVTVLSCYSRTAMIVSTLGLVVALQNLWKTNVTLPLIAIAVGLFIAFGVFASGKMDWMVEKALSGVSKSGSAEELSSATGRDAIWRYGIEQIKASPLFGYGYGAARFVMYNHSFHCHNVILNAMMAGGVLAGLLLSMQLLYVLWGMIFEPRYEIDGLAVCFLIGGIVEGLLSATTPAAHFVIWIMIIFWRPFGFSLAAEPQSVDSKTPLRLGPDSLSTRVTDRFGVLSPETALPEGPR